MIAERLEQVRETIGQAALRAGRTPGDITLVAVSKRQSVTQIATAVACGQLAFGENYLQEAQEKIEACPQQINWHFIGHLQSNKARLAARLFQVIETVDRLKTARLLDKEARSGTGLSILVQVNVGEDPRKSGVAAQQLPGLLEAIHTQTTLRVEGLMTMPPYNPDPEASRPHFARLRALAEENAARGFFADTSQVALSMGMSGDFQVAIEEGATLVRIGTSIFGERTP
ncbi:MAG: YggS family pyridoxal phosphate-dependent enzyme [Desulfobulbus propionicus]|nr:MAG: YggS family pyridoxal phosphate-dependent enzyme [Desulfobulbus propionicus]